MEQSKYDTVQDPTAAMYLPLIISPLSGPTGTGKVPVADYPYSTIVRAAILARVVEILDAGAGISLDNTTDVNKISIINTGGAGGGVGTATELADLLIGTPGEITFTVVGSDLVANLDPTFLTDIAALKAASSLVQVKTNVVGGGAGATMTAPGGAGNYISAPDSDALDPAGDLTVVARIKMPSAAPAADMAVAARWGATTVNSQWRFVVRGPTNSGQLQWVQTLDGVAVGSTITTAVTPLAFDGNWIWVRMSRTASTGIVNFYTLPDTGSNATIPAAGTWNNFQVNRASTAGNLWSGSPAHSITTKQYIGAWNDGASGASLTAGRVIAYASNTVGGTVIFDANASDYVSGSSWAGPSGNTWTLTGTASVTGGGADITGTTTQYTLGDTDDFAALPVDIRDTIFQFSHGTLGNNTGGTITATPALAVNGVVNLTGPAISLPTSTGVYRYKHAARILVSANDGSAQVVSWEFKVYAAAAAATAPTLGSALATAVLAGGDVGGDISGALSTFTHVPRIELRNTMSAAGGTARMFETATHMSRG